MVLDADSGQALPSRPRKPNRLFSKSIVIKYQHTDDARSKGRCLSLTIMGWRSFDRQPNVAVRLSRISDFVAGDVCREQSETSAFSSVEKRSSIRRGSQQLARA